MQAVQNLLTCADLDLSDLWKKRERRNHGADVLNGISVSAEEDVLYITGKNWDRMFKIRYVSVIRQITVY